MENNTPGFGILMWLSDHQFVFILFLLWTVFWGGIALWHSVKRGHMGWFFVFIIFHTIGVLEIIYLFWVLRLKPTQLFVE